jgi:hypothetical protein
MICGLNLRGLCERIFFDLESQEVMVRCGTQFGTQKGAERAVEAVHAVRVLLSEFSAC